MYAIENYKGTTPFNEQYDEIYEFLLGDSDRGLNEHFHWGRFEWMMDFPPFCVVDAPSLLQKHPHPFYPQKTGINFQVPTSTILPQPPCRAAS